MKQDNLVIILLIVLLGQHSIQAPILNAAPAAWDGGAFASSCTSIGVPKIVQDQTTAFPLTSELIYLKSSYVYTQFTVGNNNAALSQNIYKYYIQIVSSDTIQTTLQVSLISGADGSNITQTYVISGIYQFIDANGPFCLFKQTDSNGDSYLSLYSFDSTQGATVLLQLTYVADTFPNQLFNSISAVDSSIIDDSNFNGILGTVLSKNTIGNQAQYWYIDQGGLQIVVYTFTLTDMSSDVYTNLLLGLQIVGSNFYTYVSPAPGSSIPLTYTNDQTVIASVGGLYSNHIVLQFAITMVVATYDNNGQNGNIFILMSDPTSYISSLIPRKTTLTAPTGSLQYITDGASYIIELNLDPTASTFYIIWSDQYIMDNYFYQNSLGDANNPQIIASFSNQPKITSIVYAQVNDDGTFDSNLYFWIYTTDGIIKYNLLLSEDASGNIISKTLNKEYAVELVESLLTNSVGPNFEVTTQLKCVCQNTQVTEMICFYGNDACTFTVQTSPVYCNPISA